MKREREESERRERGRGRCCYRDTKELTENTSQSLMTHTPALCRSRGTQMHQSSCHTHT